MTFSRTNGTDHVIRLNGVEVDRQTVGAAATADNPLGAEAAEWLAEAETAYMGSPTTVAADMDIFDTLVTVLLERKIARILRDRT